MAKKLLLIILMISSLIFIKIHEDILKNNDSNSIQLSSGEKTPPQVDQNDELLINEVFDQAKKGMLPYAPFVIGQTEIQTVHDQWGNPRQTDTVSTGVYESYSEHGVTVGYQGQHIFDLRSYHPDLHTIHLDRIKKVKGNPDEIRFYKDMEHDQIIYVYRVAFDKQLKWVLPKPTDSEPNPMVDHISIYTEPNHKVGSQQTISEMIEKMSLSEKVGQMIFAGISGTTITQSTKQLIGKYKVGGFIFYADNFLNPQQTIELLNQLKAENLKHQLPLLLGVDQEGGRISRLPGDLIDLPTSKQIGELNSAEYSFKVGLLLGKELTAFGFNLNFAPVLDVNSNPNNPIIGDRSFGNNVEIVSKLGIETMKGIQSQNIIAVIKHFPGHGDTVVDSHLELPIVNKSLEEIRALELIPFRDAIDHGADVVMIAHILLPKLDPEFPASMSRKLMTDILRTDLNFNGVVITDDMTMTAIVDNYEIGDAAVESVKAGSDLILVAHDYDKIVAVFESLEAAVKSGEISEVRINASVARIIQLKKKYALENEPVQAVDVEGINQVIRQVLNK